MSTIYDVAKVAGCAPSTVSKYLNQSGYVSQSMGERIAQAIVDLDYHYNGLARNLSNRTNDRIGVMVPFLDHPYFQELTNAISMAASEQGKEVVIMPTAYRIEREQEYLAELEHQLVGSLIITSHGLAYQDMITYQRFGRLVFCEDIPSADALAVKNNRQATMKNLFGRLKKQGKTRIGLILIRELAVSRSTADIFQAYQDVFDKRPEQELIFYHCKSFNDGRRVGKEISLLNPDAVLTESDLTAAGVWQVIHNQLPNTMIIGQGNQLPSQLLKFSSIDQHLLQIGEQAVQLALAMVDTKQLKTNFEIIWR